MTFGQDIQAALPRLRAHAESRMVDTCLIERSLGLQPDPDNPLKRIEAWATVYEGKCRWQMRTTATQITTAGDVRFHVQQTELHLPVDGSGDVGEDMRVTAVSCVNDPSREGHRFTVTEEHSKTDATARRLLVKEVT